MDKEIPYLKTVRMALITAPLFGLLGAAPILDFNRIDLNRITTSFSIITSITLIIWSVNIVLLWFSNRLKFSGRDWLRYVVSTSVCVLVFLLVTQFIPMKRPEMPAEFIKNFPKDFPRGGTPRPMRLLMPLIQTISINLVIIVLLEILRLRDKKRIIEEENSRLRMFNLEAKHSLLKQQLHPHFLFNSLSTLSSLIKRSPQQAEEYLEKLCELLRFSINSDSQTVVGLEEELELTENYLNMQQVRFGNALNFIIDIPHEMKFTGKVPIYSVQLLVENAIKHNILTTSQPLKIVIKPGIKNNTISIENNSQPKLHIEDGSGVGLSNLAERYRLLNNEEINIDRTNDKFIVTIKVLENESCDS
jgi:two-component system LytT family sensor kinase